MTDPSYIDADAATLRRRFAIADGDEPDVLVVDGRWSARALAADVARTWPSARELDERTSLVEVAGRRAWITGAFGAAQAATYAHLAVRLGARAVVQVGSFGGLVADWAVGDVLVPSSVVGRDGVSRQLTRGEPLIPDPSLTDRLRRALAAADVSVRNGTLLSTTTIALERRSDIVRWGHAGYVGVEMEAAAPSPSRPTSACPPPPRCSSSTTWLPAGASSTRPMTSGCAAASRENARSARRSRQRSSR